MDSEGPEQVNILIVKLSAIGDVVHTLPSLAALRKLYPKAHITWVIEEDSSDIIMGHPCLDRVIISRRKSWWRKLKRLHDVKTTIGEMMSFAATLRDRQYDLVIDFHGLLKSALIVLLSGGRRKIGYDSMQELSGLFLNEKIYEDMEKHAVDRYLDLPRYLGADIQEVDFDILIGEENRKRVGALLE
ncbi:MAG TPA: glycosyltransferase family 9 protein, partial [Syntrophales bacterium]|nr:glycosyltransferase family 9 protein [Syntrophales bacterium]